jgi:hypothetical protein
VRKNVRDHDEHGIHAADRESVRGFPVLLQGVYRLSALHALPTLKSAMAIALPQYLG